MRRWLMASSLLFVVPARPVQVYRYRVEITDVSSIDDGTAPLVDTSVVAALLTLSVSDSGAFSVANVVVDSAWFRRSSGPGRGGALMADPGTVGMSYQGRVIHGLADSVMTLGGVMVPGARGTVQLAAAFHFLFPGIPLSAKAGATWTDTIRGPATSRLRTWKIVDVQGGLVTAAVADSDSSSSVSPDGEQVRSVAVSRRDVVSPLDGPVVRATITRRSHGTRASP